MLLFKVVCSNPTNTKWRVGKPEGIYLPWQWEVILTCNVLKRERGDLGSISNSL